MNKTESKLAEVIESNLRLENYANEKRKQARLPKCNLKTIKENLAKSIGLVDYKGFYVPLVKGRVPEDIMEAIDNSQA